MSNVSTLEQNLTDALTTVITDEGVLQQAIDAVKAVVTVPAVDPVVTAVVTALEAEGYTVTAPAAATDTESASEDASASDDSDAAAPSEPAAPAAPAA